ncbi:hypothetical protein D9I37_21545 [Escherichia coli]|nr:hypothetical protein [Escherichia coli]
MVRVAIKHFLRKLPGPGQRGISHGRRGTLWLSRGFQNTKMKHFCCFINFVNYITIGCLLARLCRDFITALMMWFIQ